MKSVVTNSKPKKPTAKSYPYIGISNGTPKGLIILFTSPRKGVVLSSGNTQWPVGDFDSWDEDGFEPFDGTVTLSNK